MSDSARLSQQILDSMADGVLVVDASGSITTFNPAGAAILGLDAREAEGRSLAEVFIGADGYADFVDALFEAVYSGLMQPGQMVSINPDGRVRSLKLTTSYLAPRQVGAERAVMAVFTDVTDLEQARQAEHALADELRVKHKELQDAYLEIEANSDALQQGYRRSGRTRLVMTAAVVAVFAGAGYWAMPNAALPEFGASEAQVVVNAGQPGTFEVQARAVESTTSFSGRFRPGDVMTLVSPFDSTVIARHVEYGERVTAGDLLLELDSTEIDIRYRRARSDLAEAEAELQSMEDWEQGREMASSRRGLSQAARNLNNDRRELDDVEHLFERGIVPERELRAARDRAEESRVRVEVAREDLAETSRQGGERAIARARVEVENVRAEYEQTQRQRAGARVHAPVDGVVLAPLGEERDDGERVEAGSHVSSGSALLAVGDLSSLEIEGTVDELDIHEVKAGQSAWVNVVRGGGAPMPARVSYVSSQAQEGNNRGLPSFRLIVRIDDVDEQALERIRVGMSASVDVITAENPDALIVPHSYLGGSGSERWVLRQSSGGPERAAVELGRSLFDGVQVERGVEPGDRLLPPGEED